MPTTHVDQLAQAAISATEMGSWCEAERLWNQVLKINPHECRALLGLGIHALRNLDVQRALELLRAARVAAPNDKLVLLALSSAYRLGGDAGNEREAIEACLALDAYCIPALLARGNWMERHGSVSQAANIYSNVLKIAPPDAEWPRDLRPQLGRARALVERHGQALSAHLALELADLYAKLAPSLAARWREATAIIAGCSKPFSADCNQLHIPRLPAIPFFERSEFPWVDALEQSTAVIRDELLEVLGSDESRFRPYISYNSGEPVNQWQELNHSRRWSTMHFWRSGKPVRENLDRCPETARALAKVEMADIAWLCPNAMYSVLAARTHIPPHHGETNARLVVHLPLIVPAGCSFRVGFDSIGWVEGKCIIFDDTIEHEARNESDEPRVVLIFDVWNPLLTPDERKIVQAITVAARSFSL
jgi:aspartyl/asparaginyl beta-hydroxylase (cupin superfamily)/cytochrome c-type biogenesis protein CcmH/NrfG